MLPPDRWQLVERLFHEALTHSPAERAAFLDSSCAGDPALRREIESLLSADGEWDAQQSVLAGVTAEWAAGGESLVGREIDGYRILSTIGAGGMGEVFLAEDLSLGRRAALKLIPAPFSAEVARVGRFEQEARAASALNHPNIVTVYHVGEADGRRYIATEFIEGETVRSRLGAQGDTNARLSVSTVLDIATQVTQALAAAHAVGIVHRDIKPENLMIRPDGYVKVLDFGLAKLADHERLGGDGAPDAPATATGVGAVLGTPNYMAPEQASGGRVDARADIYSLGVVVYEMLTGALPASDAATVLRERAEWKPLAPTVLRMLARDPAERVPSAAALLDELRRIRAHPARFPRRAPLAIACGVLVLALSAAAWWQWSTTRERPIAGGGATTPAIPELAVLPFAIEGFPAEQQHVGLGVAEAVVGQISHLRQVRVRPLSSVLDYTAAGAEPLAIGRRLKLRYIVSGVIVRDGDQIRLTTTLSDVGAGAPRWTESLEIPTGDSVAVRDGLSRPLATRLVETLASAERVAGRPGRTQDETAHQLYLEAQSKLRSQTVSEWLTAVSLLQQAIARDAMYADAHAALADAYRRLGSSVSRTALPRRQAIERARESALAALSIDDRSLTALLALASIQFGYDWDWVAAETSLRRAEAIAPGDPTVDTRYGSFLVAMGRLDEGFARLERAHERDPESVPVMEALVHSYRMASRWDDALRLSALAIRVMTNPATMHWRRVRILDTLGRFEEAVSEREAAAIANGAPDRARQVREAYIMSGYRAVQLAEIETRARNGELDSVAILYAAIGDFDQALDALAETIRHRHQLAPYYRLDPALAPLRSDPRFAALLLQIGLDPIPAPPVAR